MDAAIAAALGEMRERVVAAHRARQPLRLRGAGTKDFYGERFAGEPFDLRAYRGVVDYEPSELVLTARCGTPLSDIERALAERYAQRMIFLGDGKLIDDQTNPVGGKP